MYDIGRFLEICLKAHTKINSEASALAKLQSAWPRLKAQTCLNQVAAPKKATTTQIPLR